MAGKQILVVEDEKDIIDLITFNLEREGFSVTAASTGEDGVSLARQNPPHLIILDLMLPGISGLDVCRTLRRDEKTRDIPIIMLTARDEDVDVVAGLEVGADDYITKPFSPRILIARIGAVLRRRKASAESTSTDLRVGEMVIDLGRHTVKVGEEGVDLTATEFELLVVLAKRPGWVFNRSQLIDLVRGGQHIITDRAIDVQVANLRRKLGRCGYYVQTVRGVGYRIMENP